MLGKVHRHPVHPQFHAAQNLDGKSGSRDNDVGGYLRTRCQTDTAGRKAGSLPGGDGCRAVPQSREEIAVGNRAQPLIPRAVGRIQVRVEVKAVRDRTGLDAADELPGQVGPPLAEGPDGALTAGAEFRHDASGAFGADDAAQPPCDRILSGDRQDVGGSALDHGDLCTQRGQRRYQGDGGGAAADHCDALARRVHVCGPMLGMDHRPLEVFTVGKPGNKALVIAVVAGGVEDPPGSEVQQLSGAGGLGPAAVSGSVRGSRALHRHVPARPGTGPICGHHLVVVADQGIHAVLGSSVLEVLQDAGAVGNGFLLLPRAEVIAKGVKVRIGPDPGIAEQVPGAAGTAARLQERQ